MSAGSAGRCCDIAFYLGELELGELRHDLGLANGPALVAATKSGGLKV